ncbi:MAG TPA: prepilin-type N-terminal cleavage/methylation domain-containing protein [Patescibacteria group bacterium]|nr:prepilin-type N-terminal cleavage/methylation domain-containing protein [Patescibacteria group bacterium]
MKKKQGFTLIELLIVIGIIAILAAIIYVAVDPARRFAEARNAERWSSTNSILNAILKYTVDNQGSLPAPLASAIAGTYYTLGTSGSGCDSGCTSQTTVAACLDLTSTLVDSYLSSIPDDPSSGTAAKTDYYIRKTTAGRITVGACDPEAVGGSTPTISVSR